MSLARRNNEVRGAGKSEAPKLKFRVSRVTVGKRENKKRVRPKLQSCPCPLLHNFPSFPGEQPSISSNRHHMIFLFLIPVMLGLLQVEYQSKNVSPFDTHPINMWVFLAATYIYCVGLATNLELQNHSTTTYSKIISHVILSSGALASVTLALVLFPCLIGWLILCLWTILPIALARHLLKHIYEWLKHRTYNTISVGCVRFNQFWKCLTLKKQHLPITTISDV
ncbi:hypothetical protein Patl1_00198 [Pistacia atlantica]|uniref:Uncharacterized protein n=1 Tax=Pistacia atlantica TaxID=434234 RepID=A0ACC1C6H8_9ROSI|nr:hypothetical protein Patl1_00198 [Pistacia atlantica]